MASELWLLLCNANILCPAFIFLVIGAVSLAFLFTKSRTVELEGLVRYTNPETAKTTVRKLDAANFEKGIHDQLYTFGMALVSNVVFIESAVQLKTSDLRNALVMLSKRFPMLRMKFEWMRANSEGTRVRYLTEMEYPDDINISEEETVRWQERLEAELQTPFDGSSGPLWRVIRMKEIYNCSSEKYRNTLLFSFHHSVCDGLSIMAILDQFLEFLEKSLHGTDEVHRVESMPLLPPLQDLVKHEIDFSSWKALMFIVKMKFTQVINSLRRSKNLFLQKFPPVITTNPSIVKKTCFIPMMLSEKDARQLATQCKAHKCTVSGALTASAALAIRNILHRGAVKPAMTVGIGFPVNIRQDCHPVVTKEHCGTFLSPLPCVIFLPQSASNSFWELSQNISENVHSRLRKKEQYNYLRLMKYAGMKPAEEFFKVSQDYANAGRWDGLLEMSNLGKFELGNTLTGTVEFVGTHFVVAQHFCGSLLTNNIATVNGRLFWTVVFSSHVMTRNQAQEYCDLALETLKQNITM